MSGQRPQLFSERCATCVFRPNNPMRLAEGRLAELIQDNRATGSMLICHKTTYGQHPEIGETMCRGYFDAYADTSRVPQIMAALFGDGWYAVVDPPAPEQRSTPMPPPVPDELAARYARMRADLTDAGYVDVDHPTLAPGQRVRRSGEQYPEAVRDGTGVVLAVMEKPDSSWSRTYGGARDLELIVMRDQPQFGSRLSQLANYHLVPVHP